MQIVLNRFRTILVTYLQQNPVGRHTYNSLFSTKSDAHYKDKMFLYGEFLHATIKYEDQCITFLPIKPNNIIHINFVLYFVVNVLSIIFLIKNYTMDQMFNEYILVFIPIK